MLKKGILIVAHGSRAKETLDTMEQIFSHVKADLPDVPMKLAYMEFCDVNLEKGLDMLLADGINDITVVPYFLFKGMHIRKDIPEELEKYMQAHPGVKIKMGNILGADKRIAAVLTDRIREAL